MNIFFLMLYGVAAGITLYIIYQTYIEKEPIGKLVMAAEIAAFICIVAYSVNFMTDEYEIMSVASSINFASQDIMLLLIMIYTFVFTRLDNGFSKKISIIMSVFIIIDAFVMLSNIFTEFAVTYSMNLCDGVYVLGYEGSVLYVIHSLLDFSIVGISFAILIIKCMRIPRVYWGRYVFMGTGILLMFAVKYVFISKAIDIRFDLSVLMYAFLFVLIYWNTFWYSKKNMLNRTHAMMLDNMKVPVILFDYENVLADFNKDMKELFPELEYDNREQTIDWFVEEYKVPVKKEESESFTWDYNERKFECRIVSLEDEKKRVLGKILVMQDETEIRQAHQELKESLKQTLQVSDSDTEEHLERTEKLALELGRAMQLSDEELDKLSTLVMVHDIGKIAIPNDILNKKGALLDEEWEIMKSHTEKGYKIAMASRELRSIADSILGHHEHWDGTGYPNALKGYEIPLLARILVVVDAFDAMTHDRPFKVAIEITEALNELKTCAGTQFDPAIVDIFVKMYEQKMANNEG